MVRDESRRRTDVSRRETLRAVGIAGAVLTTGTGTGLAQTTDEVLRVTETYSLDTSTTDQVTVEFVVDNPEVAEEVFVWDEDSFDDGDVTTDGFQWNGEEGRWDVVAGVDRPRIEIRYTDSFETDGSRAIYEPSLTDAPSVSNRDASGQLVDEEETVVVKNGVAVDGKIYVGDFEEATASTGQGTITIVGSPSGMSETPQEVADAVAAAASEMGAGDLDQDVVGTAVFDLQNAGGRAASESFLVEEQISAYDSDVWVHEYVHTTEETSSSGEMAWFTEAWAEYGGYFYRLQAEQIEFRRFRSAVEDLGGGDLVDLSDTSQWDPDVGGPEYQQGSRVLARIDYEIRDATGGDATLEDVVSTMHTDDYVTTVDWFASEVADVAGDAESDDDSLDAQLESDVRTWLTSGDRADLPDVWDYADHQRVFEGVAVEPSLRLKGPATDRTVSDGMVAKGGQRVVFEESVTNSGDEDVTYESRLRVDDDPTSTSETVLTDAVTVAPGATATTAIEFPIQGSSSFTVAGAGSHYWVKVVGANDRIVRAEGPHGDPGYPKIIPDEAAQIALVGTSSLQTVTVRGPDGTVLAEKTTNADDYAVVDVGTGGDLVEVAVDETYEVTFGSGTDSSTQYMAGIESYIERSRGVYPRDVNGDGLHRDVTSDGHVSQADVTEFFETQHRPEFQDHPEAYDFSGNGDVSHGDVKALFDYVGTN